MNGFLFNYCLLSSIYYCSPFLACHIQYASHQVFVLFLMCIIPYLNLPSRTSKFDYENESKPLQF